MFDSGYFNLSRPLRNKIRFTIVALVAFFSAYHSLPAIAQTAASCALAIPDSWKNHFPFDLIYPIGQMYSPDGSCPVINFWGEDETVCAIPQLTAVLKYPILANIAIKGLFQL